MTEQGLTDLAKEYRRSAQKLKAWLKKNDNPDSVVDKRTKSQIEEILKQTVAVAVYLEKYYTGDRMDCGLYNAVHITKLDTFKAREVF